MIKAGPFWGEIASDTITKASDFENENAKWKGDVSMARTYRANQTRSGPSRF